MTELGTETLQTTNGRTGLHRIHRTTGPLGEALASLPRWSTAMSRWERLDALRMPVETGSTAAAVTAAVESAIDDPDPDADFGGLIGAATQAAAREHALSHVITAVDRVRATVATELDAAVVHGAARLFAALSRQLQEVIAEAALVCAVLGDIDSGDEAIAADVVNEWRLLPGLAAHHKAIRSAQFNLWVHVHGPDRRLPQLALAFMRSPHEVDAEFFARRSNARLETADGSRPANPAPWPVDMTSTDGLRWLATHPVAEPWIPTREQLDAREADLQELARTVSDDGPGSLEVAPSRRTAVAR